MMLLNANVGSPGAAWYAIKTRSRHERLVERHLSRQGFEMTLPLIRRVSQWTDRKKLIESPIFSCYCFARLSYPADRLRVLQTPGVLAIVGSAGRAEPIPDAEIESVIRLGNSGMARESEPFASIPGARVRIIRGPLAGAVGYTVRAGSRYRVLVGIQLIQRAVSVDIDVADLALDEPMPAADQTVQSGYYHPCVPDVSRARLSCA
jgi:transcription antitermination factor NusG